MSQNFLKKSGTCPLCANAAHVGKCEKAPTGKRRKWWCGLCLVDHVDTGPAIPAPFLTAAGVEKTNRWCVRCGTPVCERHRYVNTRYARNHPRCVFLGTGGEVRDCRTRTDGEKEAVESRLKVYVPDFLTAGPVRCTVCRLPAYRSSLCTRHYRHVRRGDLELPVERQVVPRGYPTVLHGVNLQPDVAIRARAAAQAAGKSFSAWAARVIQDAVDLEAEPVVPSKYTDPRFAPIVAALKATVEKKRKAKEKRETKRKRAERLAKKGNLKSNT